MANVSLVGQIQTEINHTFALTMTDMTFTGDRPVVVKKGAQGAIGSSRGIENVTGTFKFSVPVTGLEFDVVSLLNVPGGFSIQFPIGAERHSHYGCQITQRSVTNNPEAGNTEFSLNYTATEWIRLS